MNANVQISCVDMALQKIREGNPSELASSMSSRKAAFAAYAANKEYAEAIAYMVQEMYPDGAIPEEEVVIEELSTVLESIYVKLTEGFHILPSVVNIDASYLGKRDARVVKCVLASLPLKCRIINEVGPRRWSRASPAGVI